MGFTPFPPLYAVIGRQLKVERSDWTPAKARLDEANGSVRAETGPLMSGD